MTTRPPAAPPPAAAPPPQKKKAAPAATIPDAVPLNITTGDEELPDRIVIYGTGGVGKTTLAAALPDPFFIDLDKGVRKRLRGIKRDATVRTFMELRGKLASIEKAPPAGVKFLVVDTLTVAQEMAVLHVTSTRKTEKDKPVDSIEGFGWNRGWNMLYEEMVGLIADLDRLNSMGFGICLNTHVVSTVVPHPNVEEFLRWEPNLYGGDKRGRGSVRELVKNWADHVLFVGYDVYVDKETSRAQGSGSRTIYTYERPTHLAKTRSEYQHDVSFELDDPGAIWRALEVAWMEPATT